MIDKLKETDTIDLEKQALAGLLKEGESGDDIWNNAGVHLDASDFASKSGARFNGTIFSLIKTCREKRETVSPLILAMRLRELQIQFPDDLTPLDYLQALQLFSITKDGAIQAICELKKYSVARKMIVALRKAQRNIADNVASLGIGELIKATDDIYHQEFTTLLGQKDNVVDIYDTMEAVVEERGNNPQEENGPTLDGWPRLHGIYGSLWTPEDITVIVARSGVGKTTIALDWNARISAKYGIPVLHFDNGEMSDRKLIFRQCAAETGVPLYAIETGKWRKNAQFTEIVRAKFAEIKSRPRPIIHYVDVGGMSVQEMINVARRHYFSRIGRGNPMIISFDYIKTSFEFSNKDEHQMVGEMMDRWKQFIKTEMKFDGKPVISMFTSVQQNRYGVDDTAISLSDRIKQFSSFIFLLHKKTSEELMLEPANGQFGTHYLKALKYRSMGEFQERNGPVKMMDGTLQDNVINLKISNFFSEERGDLQDMVDYQKGLVKAQ